MPRGTSELWPVQSVRTVVAPAVRPERSWQWACPPGSGPQTQAGLPQGTPHRGPWAAGLQGSRANLPPHPCFQHASLTPCPCHLDPAPQSRTSLELLWLLKNVAISWSPCPPGPHVLQAILAAALIVLTRSFRQHQAALGRGLLVSRGQQAAGPQPVFSSRTGWPFVPVPWSWR